MKLFTIYDRAAATYGAPFQAPNEALAVRMFEQTQLDTSHVFATHANDFQIHYLGDFDESNGAWNLLDKPLPCSHANGRDSGL